MELLPSSLKNKLIYSFGVYHVDTEDPKFVISLRQACAELTVDFDSVWTKLTCTMTRKCGNRITIECSKPDDPQATATQLAAAQSTSEVVWIDVDGSFRGPFTEYLTYYRVFTTETLIATINSHRSRRDIALLVVANIAALEIPYEFNRNFKSVDQLLDALRSQNCEIHLVR
jgi:hypothetical protein